MVTRGGGSASAMSTPLHQQSQARTGTTGKSRASRPPPSSSASKRSSSGSRLNQSQSGNSRNEIPRSSSAGTAGPEEEEVWVPSSTEGRVKVAVRCRPPFEDELEEGPLIVDIPQQQQQQSQSHEETKENGEETASGSKPVTSGEVDVMTNEKKKRFVYDRAFSPTASQDEVYNEVGGPIVADVMSGYNGSILAYGQTGTGKTYTMGILNRVTGAHTGIIPRGLSHVFGHISQESDKEWSVSMSFVQIYLETVQDLFSASLVTSKLPHDASKQQPNPSANNKNSQRSAFGSGIGKAGRDKERLRANLADDSLQVREDPKKGFFVEGLSEYTVNSYEEAIELLNWGLENRVMGYTKMNATSSRSHTLLTVRVFQKGFFDFEGRRATRKLSGKLMFVDLAGSERVRRTESQGSRLVEARSINQSLSALGNVIAALADKKTSHIPFRDSKLTRLLQGCLGGGASTYLIATIGPSVANESETLSTLTFASRCMSVRSSPVLNEEVDYAVLCARLQAKLSDQESEFLKREDNLRQLYERRINDLLQQNQQMSQKLKETSASQEHAPTDSSAVASEGFPTPVPKQSGKNRDAIKVAAAELGVSEDMLNISEWGYIYRTVTGMYDMLVELFIENAKEDELALNQWKRIVGEQQQSDKTGVNERSKMSKHDPLQNPLKFGPHLPKNSPSDILQSTQNRFGSNNEPRNSDKDETLLSHPSTATWFKRNHPKFKSFRSITNIQEYMKILFSDASKLITMMAAIWNNKDSSFNDLKKQFAVAETQQRQREEELMNQSFVLKQLIDKNTGLKEQNGQLQEYLKKMEQETLSLKERSREDSPPLSGSSAPNSEVPNGQQEPHLQDQYQAQQYHQSWNGIAQSIDDPVKLRKMEERQKLRQMGWPSAEELGRPTAGDGSHRRAQELPPLPPKSASRRQAEVLLEYERPQEGVYNEDNHTNYNVNNGIQEPSYPQRGRQENGLHQEAVETPNELEEEAEEEEEDVVERIVDKREHEGQVFYKVHWNGTSSSEDEWFLSEDLQNDFPEVVEEFERALEDDSSVHTSSTVVTADLDQFETYASRFSQS